MANIIPEAKGLKYGIGLLIVVFTLFAFNLILGSVSIPLGTVADILLGHPVEKESWRFIVLESRFPQAVTAFFCGSALAVSGLMLQTAFNNPLAGPSILGINTGASLGVALVMLLWGGGIAVGTFSISGFVSVIIGAFVGAMSIMALILFFSSLLKSNIMVLIIGIMIGYITSSAISLLNFFATAEGVHSYAIWGMGNFGAVSNSQLPLFVGLVAGGLFLSILLIKPLNALLLGYRYAENLGVNIQRVRNWLLITVGLLTAVTTAFCGPISFIGLAVPHVARLLLGTSNHNSLLPITLLLGGGIALLCNLICILPGQSGVIPLNAVTPFVGAPVIIYVIVNQRKIQYFN
ncbi:MAG: iron ABC transporter permease [Bacteroidia bacterium]|nr:iron ABC transporter permease [Bacteroidia bacterium]